MQYHPASRIKVLAVDDKPANLLALEAVLDDANYTLLRAYSGMEALKILEENKDIVLILLDVQMPGMDGFEVARRIKKMKGVEDVPVIFITAVSTDDPFVRQGYEVGGIDYFSKPFDPDVLRKKVKIYATFQQKTYLLKEKERQLQESEALLQAARKHSARLETLNVGVLVSDKEGRICQTNDALLKILLSMGQAEHDSYGEFLAWWESDGHVIKQPDGPLLRALKGQSSPDEILQIKCFDHSNKTVSISASALRGRDGQIVGAVVVIRDITQQR